MAGEKSKALAQLIDLLEPLSDEERLRAVNAALTFLGTNIVSTANREERHHTPSAQSEGEQIGDLPARAARWLKQNEITDSQLENVFHFGEGNVQVIAADVPGNDSREKSRQCYLLVGARKLLQDGEPQVSDQEARELCRSIGCYNPKHHTKAVKGLGNLVTGSKSSGFELTQPGLRAAAEMIKTMANA